MGLGSGRRCHHQRFLFGEAARGTIRWQRRPHLWAAAHPHIVRRGEILQTCYLAGGVKKTAALPAAGLWSGGGQDSACESCVPGVLLFSGAWTLPASWLLWIRLPCCSQAMVAVVAAPIHVGRRRGNLRLRVRPLPAAQWHVRPAPVCRRTPRRVAAGHCARPMSTGFFAFRRTRRARLPAVFQVAGAQGQRYSKPPHSWPADGLEVCIRSYADAQRECGHAQRWFRTLDRPRPRSGALRFCLRRGLFGHPLFDSRCENCHVYMESVALNQRAYLPARIWLNGTTCDAGSWRCLDGTYRSPYRTVAAVLLPS